MEQWEYFSEMTGKLKTKNGFLFYWGYSNT